MKRALLPLLAASLLLTACGVAPGAKQPTASVSGVTCAYRTTNAPAKVVDPPNGTGVPATGTEAVTLTFASGVVQITLDRAAAPCTANSFESLAQQGFFTDTTCHRMSTAGYYFLQCGDPSGTGRGTPGYSFNDELTGKEKYTKGTVAMANSGPNTNGSQFFIVYGDSGFPPNYTLFGHIDEAGIKVLTTMGQAGTDNSEGQGIGKPLGDTTITSATLG